MLVHCWSDPEATWVDPEEQAGCHCYVNQSENIGSPPLFSGAMTRDAQEIGPEYYRWSPRNDKVSFARLFVFTARQNRLDNKHCPN